MDIERVLFNYMSQYPMATKILREVEKCGETFLFGGALRAYADNKDNFAPRDIDIVVDSKKNEHLLKAVLLPYNPMINRFGGYKIKYKDLSIDIWSLKRTWAFENKVLIYKEDEYREHLQDTVFLNIDSIVYNLTNNILYDEKYNEAMKTRILDVVLQQNPEMKLNILRTFILKKQYSMELSKRLTEILKSNIKENINFINDIMDIQKKRYVKNIIKRNELQEEINQLFMSSQKIYS